MTIFEHGVVTFEAKALGWVGDARMIRIPLRADAQFATAVKQKMTQLGLDDPGELEGADRLQFATGTPERWLAADKLGAYIEGVADALSGEYGRQDEPVVVTRGDLTTLLAATHDGLLFRVGQDLVTRLYQALNGE